MSNPSPEQGGTPKTDEAAKTFTQEEVNRLVGETRRTERSRVEAQFPDYVSLKAQAEGAKTAEQRVAGLEARLTGYETAAERQKLVTKVAHTHKITDPDDIALFLTGSDEETLTAQAKRLATRAEPQRKANYVPSEGQQANGSAGSGELGEFARNLFHKE